MKTEIIDFDLELAKKITSGEIKGEVLYCSKTRPSPIKARIICFDIKYGEHIYRGIALITAPNGSEYIRTFSLDSGCIELIENGAKLKLKVPTQYTLKPGDFISDEYSIGIFNRVEDDLVSTVVIYKPVSHAVRVSEYLCGVNNVKRATPEERDLLLQGLKENGYDWDAEKLELVKIEEHKFKPFDRVIGVISCGVPIYQADLFSHMEDDGAYACIGGTYEKVYPFEGNEHLLKKKE